MWSAAHVSNRPPLLLRPLIVIHNTARSVFRVHVLYNPAGDRKKIQHVSREPPERWAHLARPIWQRVFGKPCSTLLSRERLYFGLSRPIGYSLQDATFASLMRKSHQILPRWSEAAARPERAGPHGSIGSVPCHQLGRAAIGRSGPRDEVECH